MVFTGIRVGAYGKIRDLYGGKQKDGFLQKILAGMTTGSLGILVANPFDVIEFSTRQVIKVRYQAQSLN